MWGKKTPGFTIIELLVVIVVIAILASVTVVGFRGVQERSANTARIASARKMHTLLRQYVTIYGAESFKNMVPASETAGRCLGENFANAGPDVPFACRYAFNTSTGVPQTGYTFNSLPALDDALKALGSYESSYPQLSYTVSQTNMKFTTPYLLRIDGPNYIVDGKPNMFGAVSYVIEGAEQDCGLKPMLRYVSSVNGIYNYTITDGSKYSGTSTSPAVTVCNAYFHPDAV